MNRHDFSVAYAKRAGITQEASAKTCEEVFDLLFDCIGSHDRVYIKGLGTFTHVTRKPRKVGNLHGGEPITIPERDDIKFMPYQYTVDTVPDPMASASATDTAMLSQAIAASISELGLPEFMKRLGVMSAASPYEVDAIHRRTVKREEKGVCPYCGKEFKKRYAHQKYCNGKCREANYRRGMTEFSAYEHDHRVTGGRNVTINL